MWQTFGRAWGLPGMPLAMPLFETNVFDISHAPTTLVSVLWLCMAYNSGIIRTEIVIYYS